MTGAGYVVEVIRPAELSARDLNRRRHPRCRPAHTPGGLARAGWLPDSSPVPGPPGKRPTQPDQDQEEKDLGEEQGKMYQGKALQASAAENVC